MKEEKQYKSEHFSRQLSPTYQLNSIHIREKSNLEILDQLASNSVMKRLKSHEPTEPTLTEIQNIQINRRKLINPQQPKTIKTKQPSLPYLQSKNEFYNKWYIPYDQRYVHKPNITQQLYEDELYFYKNIHNMYVQYNPFEARLPEDLLKNMKQKERSNEVKEMLKGQKQIIEFKRSLEKQQQRIPIFIQQIMQEDSKQKKHKQ